MKKYIPYFVTAIIIIAIIVIAKPWKNVRESEIDTLESQASSNSTFLPADDSSSSGIAPASISIFMENSGSMDGYINLNSELVFCE